MLRVNREVVNRDFDPYTCGNLLAGSILNLEPDTEYQVHCMLSDPDGGEADTTVVVRTRQVPVAPEPVRTLHLYPGSKPAQDNAYASFRDLVKVLEPGDLVLIHGGVHITGPEGIRIEDGGTRDRPIVFRGAGDGEPIILADYIPTVFDISDCNHLFFEDLTINAGDHPYYEGGQSSCAFYAERAGWLTIRNCIIENVRTGIWSIKSERSVNWYIADNIITGYNPQWYPRVSLGDLEGMGKNPSHTGINLYGRGHVVCHNRVSRFYDCIAIADYGPPPHDPHLKCVAIDIYNNDLSEAIDDGIETDYGCHNIRVFNNRIMNAHTGMSAQPTYGGPVYFIRNELYNITVISLKFHNYCTGLEVYHNSIVAPRHAFQSSTTWQNGILRNNLFLGFRGSAVHTGSAHPKTSLDYNGYRKAGSGGLIRWDDGTGFRTYATLNAFHEGTGFEEHGIMVDISIFEKAAPPVEGTTYEQGSMDLSLKAGSPAVDTGVVLTNVNDGYTGNAPDLGCFERGKPKPHYGPRELREPVAVKQKLLVTVVGRATGEPVDSAELGFHAYLAITNDSGQASMELFKGKWVFTVRHGDYFTLTDTVIITCDTSLVIPLTEKHEALVRVVDRATGEPINRAEIHYGDDLKNTGNTGLASIDLTDGKWVYSVQHRDYFMWNDSVVITSDTSLVIPLTRKLANIEFEIGDSSGPVAGAAVTLNNWVVPSNSGGIAWFYNRMARQNYRYTIEKNGYRTISDSLFLEIDTTVKVVLQLTTNTDESATPATWVFPVPASHKLYIRTGSGSARAVLIDPQGRALMERRLNKGLNPIDVSGIPPGVYVLCIGTKEHVAYKRVVIKP
jgi:hypothetical protein